MTLTFRTTRNLGLAALLLIIVAVSLFSYRIMSSNARILTSAMTAKEARLIKWFDLLRSVEASEHYLNNYKSGEIEIISPILLLVENAVKEIENIKNYLKQKLPSYMLPSKIYSLDRLPMNSSDKVDRTALEKEILKTL